MPDNDPSQQCILSEHSAVLLAQLAGGVVAAVGTLYLAAWLGGYMAQRGISTITMKTNAALSLLLCGLAMVLLGSAAVGGIRRRMGQLCAVLSLLIGVLTFSENVVGWNLRIDQLLAQEPPGAMGVVSPNRMGLPASLSFILVGAALLLLSRRDRRGVPIAQGLALAVCLLALMSAVGFLYRIQSLYATARVTTIAWPTTVALGVMGIGLLCAGPAEGLMAQVTADDPGGLMFRRLLLPIVVASVGLGWLHLAGERRGFYDSAMGAGLLVVVVIVTFLAVAWAASRQVSLSARLTASVAQFAAESPTPVLRLDNRGQVLYANPAAEALLIGEGWKQGEAVPARLREPGGTPLSHCREIGSFDLVCSGGQAFSFLCKPFPTKGYVNFYGRDVTQERQTELTLRDEQHRLRLAQQAARIGTFEWNVQTGVNTWTPELEAMYGLLPDEFGKTQVAWEQLVHPEDRAAAVDAVHRALATGEPVEAEWRVIWRNGGVHWIAGRFQAFNDGGDRPLRLVGVNIDVTGRKRVEANLLLSESRFRSLFEHSMDGIFLTNGGGVITAANPAACAMFGMSEEELRRAGRAGIMNPDDPRYTPAIAERALIGSASAELTWVRKDGTIFPAEVQSVLVGEKKKQAFVVLRDISERKRAEDALRESEQRFRAMADAMPQLAWIANADGWIHWYNRRWYEYTGATPKDMEGWGWQSVHDPKMLPAVLERWKASIATGRPFEMVFPLRGADGIFRPFLTRVQPMKDAQGRVIQWFGTNTDVDELKRAEKAQSLLAAIVESSDDAIVSKDLDGTILSWNAGAEQLFGYEKAEIIGQPITLLLPPERIEEEQEMLARLQRGERVSHMETVRVAKDGRRIDVSVTASPLKDRSGHVIGASKIARDVTDRKRAEELLRESEARLATTVENLSEGVVVADAQGNPLHWNRAALTIHGFASEEEARRRLPELAGMFELAALDGTVLSIEQWPLPRILRGEVLRGTDVRLRPLKGDWERVVTYAGSLVRDRHGQSVLAVVGIADITERTRAEEALRASERQYRELFQTMQEPFFAVEVITDAAGKPVDLRWVEANSPFYRYMGISPEELYGRTYRQWAPHPDPAWIEMLGEVALTGQPITREIYASSLGRWLEVHAYSPQPKQAAAVFDDITERKRLEEILADAQRSSEQAKVAAEEASRAKDNFLAVLSHELRNPLTPVLPALAATEKLVPEEGKEYVEIARRNVELEARLIDDLLDVTRIARGKIELECQPVCLCDVIQRAAEVCEPDIEARRLHFGIKIEDGPCLVDADPARLQQVFWNLIKNAVKFTPHGGCVGVHCWREDSRVITQVNDSGQGIEPEALGRIFNAFEQESRATTRRFGGLGLGLAISKTLVELHGGTIQVHSDGKDKGATFTVTLPITELRPGKEPVAAAEAQPAVAARRLRILLVEDHGDTARMMGRLLTAEGHTIRHAGDVATALELAGCEEFDLLVSDLGLPDGSGHDLMRQLRARGQRLPGIALSGYGMAADVQKSREAGFAAHVTKPVDFDALLAAVNRVVNAVPDDV